MAAAASLQVAAMLIPARTRYPARFVSGLQLRPAPKQLYKSFRLELAGSGKTSCSIHSDISNLAQKCVHATKLVGLALGERVPFLFTIKQLVATGKLEGFSGQFLVPSYRGSSFLNPKERGGSSGYDNTVALPTGGRGDEEELTMDNIKNTASSNGKIILSMSKSKPEIGEVIAIFESLWPSDLGAKAPKAGDM